MIKNIFITIFACIAILMYSGFTVSAEDNSATAANGMAASAETTSQTSNSASETQSDDSDNDLNKILGEAFLNGEIDLSDSENSSKVDYYGDDYYDTDGNATLINNQKIIYNSDEMQFISVTTKDGNVFYVLINYSDEDNIDNVYFLNKVDDYDLYALLYAGDESSGDVTPAQAAANANGSSDSETDSNNSVDDSQSQAEDEKTPAKSSNQGMMKNLMILGGAVAIGAVVFFIMLKSKKKNKPSASNDDMYDFDDGDDIEINEDEE